jgi:hypothetical protein
LPRIINFKHNSTPRAWALLKRGCPGKEGRDRKPGRNQCASGIQVNAWYQYTFTTDGIKDPTQPASILYYQSIIITWWVSQDERIVAYPSYYQLQSHPNVNINISLLYECRDKHEEHLHPTFKSGVRYVPAHLLSISFVQHAV